MVKLCLYVNISILDEVNAFLRVLGGLHYIPQACSLPFTLEVEV
jgi:hypothetical protein